MKTKILNQQHMLNNINGLSLHDRAYCGPYGTILCYQAANGRRNARKFSVSGNTNGILKNRAGYTMSTLRKAIIAK